MVVTPHSARFVRGIAWAVTAVLCGLLMPARAADLVLDKVQSQIQIQVKDTFGSFVAQLSDYQATITVAPQTGRVAAAHFDARFTGIHTGISGRDADMIEWEQSDQFPRVNFVLHSLEPGPQGTYLARGSLFFHGVERPVRFPIVVTTDRRLLAVDGELPVDTRDFGLPVIRKFWILRVNPVVLFRFHLQGNISGS